MQLCGIKPLSFALAFAISIASIVLGIAITIVLTPRQLSDPIVKYNDAVDVWNSYHVNIFRSYSFNASTSLCHMNHALTPNTKDEHAIHRYFRELQPKRPLKYDLLSGLITMPIYFNECDDASINVTLSYTNSTTVYDTQFTMKLFLTIPWSFNESDCSNFGIYNHGICFLKYRLNHICVKVVNDDSPGPTLIFDDTYGNIGCQPTDTLFEDVLGPWNPARYVPFNASAAIENPSKPVDFSDFTMELRHAKDPIIFAFNITDGSLNFSDLERDDNINYSIRVYTGYGIGILALAVLLPVIITCLCMCSNPKRRRTYMYITPSEEHQQLLKTQYQRDSESSRWSSSWSAQGLANYYKHFKPTESPSTETNPTIITQQLPVNSSAIPIHGSNAALNKHFRNSPVAASPKQT